MISAIIATLDNRIKGLLDMRSANQGLAPLLGVAQFLNQHVTRIDDLRRLAAEAIDQLVNIGNSALLHLVEQWVCTPMSMGGSGSSGDGDGAAQEPSPSMIRTFPTDP